MKPQHLLSTSILLSLLHLTSATQPAPTKTKIWSTTESTTTFVQWINPRKATIYTTKTVTSLEPRPTFTSYPGTVTVVVVSHVRLEGRTTYSNGETTTSTTEWVATVPETWVVSRPTAGGGVRVLGGEERVGCPGPGAGAGSCDGKKGDARCEAGGMRTGCQGQCVRRVVEEGRGEEWWCYMMHQRDYVNEEMRMGRACWAAEGLRYRQLNVPCLEGDLAMGCVECVGVDGRWGAVNWEGDEAGD